MSSASKVLSDLQWVEEKLLRPYTVLVKAMQEAAEVEQGVEGKKLQLQSLKADIGILESKLANVRVELQTLQTTQRQRINDTTHEMEVNHVSRMHALDAEHRQAVEVHTKSMERMRAEHETYRQSLEQTKEEYRGAHRKLQAEHDAAVVLRKQQITTLDTQLTALKTKHSNFLKEVGHVVS